MSQTLRNILKPGVYVAGMLVQVCNSGIEIEEDLKEGGGGGEGEGGGGNNRHIALDTGKSQM